MSIILFACNNYVGVLQIWYARMGGAPRQMEMRMACTLAMQRRMPYNYRSSIDRRDKKACAQGGCTDKPELLHVMLVSR